jgi:hypothetical protein
MKLAAYLFTGHGGGKQRGAIVEHSIEIKDDGYECCWRRDYRRHRRDPCSDIRGSGNDAVLIASPFACVAQFFFGPIT